MLHYRHSQSGECSLYFITGIVKVGSVVYASLTLFPLGYFEDLSPLGGGGGLIWPPPPQISATNGPIDSKIGTVVKQVK